MNEPLDSLFEVSLSKPTPAGHRTNLIVYAVTSTVERAFDMVREKYPNCTLHRIERRTRAGAEVLVDVP